MSLSVALKRPERNFGGIIDSRASSFTDGSVRVYISVVCMCACPSHSETFRKSLVACSTGIEQPLARSEVWSNLRDPGWPFRRLPPDRKTAERSSVDS
jgi:hypothetical protein